MNNKIEADIIKRSAKRILAIVLTMAISLTTIAIPQQAYAATKKNKVKYKVTIHNISSKTVLKKGTKLKIIYTATQTKKGKVSNTKVKFRSSNKRVATVSKKGVIKAKKKGTVKITVYCKNQPSKKKTVKIRVGSYTTYAHKYTVQDSKWIAHRGLHTSATENTAAAFIAAGKAGGFWGCECDIWETRHKNYLPEPLPEDPDINNETTDNDITTGTVDKETADEDSNSADGRETGLNDGEIIGDIEESVNENIAEHSEVPDDEFPSEESEVSVDPGVNDVVDKINALELSSLDNLGVLDRSEEIKDAKRAYDELEAAQKYRVREALQDDAGNEGLQLLLDAVSAIQEYESFDLVINHDTSYQRIFGVSSYVWDLTRDQVIDNSALNGRVCFLEDYVRICKQYGMVPVIETKGESGHLMSEEAIKKMVDTVYIVYAETGGDSAGNAAVRNACYISFQEDSLIKTKKYIEKQYGFTPVTYYLISSEWSSKIDVAARNGFTGVSVTKKLLTDNFYNKAKSYGLGVGIWTYKDKTSDDALMYDHLITGRYRLDFSTVDFIAF